MRILNEEWPQKGAKAAKKKSLFTISFFEPFAPFCGQMPFAINQKAARMLGPA